MITAEVTATVSIGSSVAGEDTLVGGSKINQVIAP